MAKTDWNMYDTVKPEDMNQIGEELNEAHEQLFESNTTQTQLTRGLQTIETTRQSLAGVGFQGKTVVNHAPLFDSGVWDVNGDATVSSDGTTLTQIPTSTHGLSYCYLTLKGDTTYTLSLYTNGRCMARQGHDPNGSVINPYIGLGNFGYKSITFITPTDGLVTIRIDNGTDTQGEIIYSKIMLNEGYEPQEFVANVQHLQGVAVENVGKNLVPPFTSNNDWVLNGNVTIESPTKVVLNADGTDQYSYVNVPCKPDTAYTLSATHDGKIKLTTLDADLNFINEGSYTTDQTDTLTTESNAAYIRVMFSNHNLGNGAFTFENIQLEQGEAATLFEPYKKTHAYVKDQIGQWDELYPNGEIFKGGEYDVELSGELDWVFPSSGTYSGYKRVRFSYIPIPSDEFYLVKYNGLILKHFDSVALITNGDEYRWATDGLFDLTIPNTDSGWGDNYTPTNDEIKAYFYGWKMLVKGQSRRSVYNGTGEKEWVRITRLNDSESLGSLVDVTDVLPTEPAGTDELGNTYTPYKLSYKLAKPYIKKADIDGNLQVYEGNNHIKVYEGVVARERANPLEGATAVWINNINQPLSYQVDKILTVYENSRVFHQWTRDSIGDYYGNERVKIEYDDFNPTATYYVTYTVLDKDIYTPQIDEVTLQYQESIKSVVDDHTERIGELQTLQNVIAPIAMDSQIVETGSNANGEYVRWANGWQMCTFKVLADSSNANLSTSKISYDWYYPASFSQYPNMIATYDLNKSSFTPDYDEISGIEIESERSLSYGRIFLPRINGMTDFASTDSIKFSMIAIGRWK